MLTPRQGAEVTRELQVDTNGWHRFERNAATP